MSELTSYRRAQRRFVGTDFPPGGEMEKKATENFARFFGNLTEANARELTAATYAPELYFYDTFKEIGRIGELEEYFVETARNTESVRARILDVARSGADFYMRWEMDIRLKKFRRGRTLESAGMTHLRFDPQGRIVLHHDYWDSAAGFYQHVPVLGGAVRFVKSLF